MFLTAGETCWRLAHADRAAFIIDYQDYYAALRSAFAQARHAIWLLGWGFDPRARLEPDGTEGPDDPDEIGHVLLGLAAERPDLDIRILVWKSALPVAISQEFFPHRAARWFRGSRVQFVLDDQVPFGACHHQKAVIVDGALAFSGGGDISVDRFDSQAHKPGDMRRLMPNGKLHPPRHEVMIAVDGKAAEALTEHFAIRWFQATGEDPVIPLPPEGHAPWPVGLTPSLDDVEIGIARTDPAWRGDPGAHEIEQLILRSIGEARQVIYMENQYFTSPMIGEALAARLAEPDGPQVVLVSTGQSPSYFDRLTMDRTRAILIWRLKAADIFGRFRAYHPVTAAGEPIIVHAKTTVIDDVLARIGSANLNNRSLGFDTELELAYEAPDETGRAIVAALRDRLVGHWMGVGATEVALARANGGLIGAIEHLNRDGRLIPIEAPKLSAFGEFVAHYHLGDPHDPADSWNIARRRDRLFARAREMAAQPPKPTPPDPPPEPPIES